MLWQSECEAHRTLQLMTGQGGTISHEKTVANLTQFSREVLPRLGELR